MRLHYTELDRGVRAIATLNMSRFVDRMWTKHVHKSGWRTLDPDKLRLASNRGKSMPDPIFTFADLFAGIGGIRIGLERQGGLCVGAVEWDRWACATYRAYFKDDASDHLVEGDVRQVAALPAHDVIAAGFPCQPFSIAGVSKKASLGRPHGFLDKTQGTLFHEVARLAEAGNTPVLLLENVKHLLRHDRGRTYAVIETTLKELGYSVWTGVIDAQPFVPQHRERVFIVALRREIYGDRAFIFPNPPDTRPVLDSAFFEAHPAAVYTKSEHVWRYLQRYAEKHRAAGNGFGFGLVSLGRVARTLSARYYKDGSEILVRQGAGPPRMLTPGECRRLMGFPDDFPTDVVSRTQAYKQFGNSVVVPVVQHVAKALVAQAILPVPVSKIAPPEMSEPAFAAAS
jgi:DNA (cytosine-5)-methyltransferase 1